MFDQLRCEFVAWSRNLKLVVEKFFATAIIVSLVLYCTVVKELNWWLTYFIYVNNSYKIDDDNYADRINVSKVMLKRACSKSPKLLLWSRSECICRVHIQTLGHLLSCSLCPTSAHEKLCTEQRSEACPYCLYQIWCNFKAVDIT